MMLFTKQIKKAVPSVKKVRLLYNICAAADAGALLILRCGIPVPVTDFLLKLPTCISVVATGNK